MKKAMLLIMALSILAAPAMAGRITSTTITHFNQVFQVCPATSDCACWEGYSTANGSYPITAAPGVLCIVPGTPSWSNFIGAYFAGTGGRPPLPSGTIISVKNVTLVKECPEYVQCNGIFPTAPVPQQGTPNIRLWWPLMYEVPSCTFTLTILYGTSTLWDDDGTGPNPPSWVHAEQWVWHVDMDLAHLSLLLDLFHELPFGLDEVPLISDEPLFTALQDKVLAALSAYEAGDTFTASNVLSDFELEVMDACIGVSPANPNPTGPGTGIAQTAENPVCCKLLVDIEYIFQTTGIGQPKK